MEEIMFKKLIKATAIILSLMLSGIAFNPTSANANVKESEEVVTTSSNFAVLKGLVVPKEKELFALWNTYPDGKISTLQGYINFGVPWTATSDRVAISNLEENGGNLCVNNKNVIFYLNQPTNGAKNEKLYFNKPNGSARGSKFYNFTWKAKSWPKYITSDSNGNLYRIGRNYGIWIDKMYAKNVKKIKNGKKMKSDKIYTLKSKVAKGYWPTALAVGKKNNVYFLCNKPVRVNQFMSEDKGLVYKYNLKSKKLTKLSGIPNVMKDMRDIAIDNKGNLYVAGKNGIVKFYPNKTTASEVMTEEDINIVKIALGSKGDLYCAVSIGATYKISAKILKYKQF